MRLKDDITYQRFGRLTAIVRVENGNSGRMNKQELPLWVAPNFCHNYDALHFIQTLIRFRFYQVHAYPYFASKACFSSEVIDATCAAASARIFSIMALNESQFSFS